VKMLATFFVWYSVGAVTWTAVRAGLLLSFWNRGILCQLEVVNRFRNWRDHAVQAALWPISILVHVESWFGKPGVNARERKREPWANRIAQSLSSAVFLGWAMMTARRGHLLVSLLQMLGAFFLVNIACFALADWVLILVRLMRTRVLRRSDP